jgi:8-oxo-dGTP diphosphatase
MDHQLAPIVVVGAAIIRSERGSAGVQEASVLCARRSAPERIAGKWEFPGGKVEPGETDADAIVRECREELGVEVQAGAQIGADQTIDERHVLRIYRARLLPDQPEPLPLEDHDVLAWVPAADLLALDWLPADVPVVAEMTVTALIV